MVDLSIYNRPHFCYNSLYIIKNRGIIVNIMNNKRKLALILSGLILSNLLVACGDSADDAVPDAPDGSTAAEPTENETIPSSLTGLDFGGESVSILWWEENNEFVEEQDGDVVNDALFERDRNIEEMLNVTLDHIGMSYTWSTRDIYIGAIRNSVMSGDGIYDIVSGQYATMPTLITDGIYLNLENLEHLDFTQPWWINDLIEETAIDGRLYLAAGNMSTTSISTICCMFGNKRLFEEYQLDNPIELVTSGNWTLDTVREIVADTYQDLNGNELADAEDSYGLVLYNTNGITGFQQSFGLKVTTNNADGIPELSFGTERVTDAIENLRAFIYDSEGVYLGKDAELEQNYRIFTDGRAVLTTGFFGNAANEYNDMADDYYILPYPKYDDTQTEYATRLGEANTLFGITASCADPNMAAATLEALAYEGYATVAPAYYEVALKIKYSRSDESAQMFDLIRESVVFDFGALYGGALGIPFNAIKNFIAANNTNWSSYYASNETAAQTAIDNFAEDILALED